MSRVAHTVVSVFRIRLCVSKEDQKSGLKRLTEKEGPLCTPGRQGVTNVISVRRPSARRQLNARERLAYTNMGHRPKE